MRHLVWLVLAAGCARPAPPPSYAPPPSHAPAPQAPLSAAVPAAPQLYEPRGLVPFQGGKATYYHDSLAGNATASGEPYDPRAMTAAHRSLPFGSVVDVVRGDGRWVRVRINDRGPYGRGRIIDLSRTAAEAVGLLQAGVADVTLYLVYRPEKTVSRMTAGPRRQSKR